MQPRVDLTKFSGSGSSYKAMLGLEASLAQSTLPVALKHMLKLRASQINAYCIDMHWKDARAAGESEQRLYGLDAWAESPYYTDRERAALAYMESVTRISDTHVPDDVFDRVRSHFSDQEVVDLTWLAATINAWNRVAISLRSEPGKYQPPAHAKH
jgi:AhpD family alkylhydroperoxidase